MSRLSGEKFPGSFARALPSVGVGARLNTEPLRPPSVSDEAHAEAHALLRHHVRTTAIVDASSSGSSEHTPNRARAGPVAISEGLSNGPHSFGARASDRPQHDSVDGTPQQLSRRGPTSFPSATAVPAALHAGGMKNKKGKKRKERRYPTATPMRGARFSSLGQLGGGLVANLNRLAERDALPTRSPLRFVVEEGEVEASMRARRARRRMQRHTSLSDINVGVNSGNSTEASPSSLHTSMTTPVQVGSKPRRRTRDIGQAPPGRREKFRPNLEIVKHNMSPGVVATLRKNFVPKGVDSPLGDGAGGAAAAASRHYSLAHPPLPGQRANSPHNPSGQAIVTQLSPPRGVQAHFPSRATFLGGGGGAHGAPTFGKLDGARLAAEIARWLVGMGDFRTQYNSVSVFLQVKLAEIESLAGHQSRPNMCRTAVAFGLLDLLINKLSTFADTLLPIRTELLQSVYPQEELKNTKLPWDMNAKPVGKLTTQETLEELFKCHTFYDLLKTCRRELQVARDDLVQQRDDAAKEQIAAIHHASVQARKNAELRARVFYAWKACWAENAQRKRILAHKALAPLVPGISQRDVFAAWHRVVLLSRCAKIQQNCQSNARNWENVQASLEQAQAEHEQTKQQLRDVQAKLATSQKQTLNVKEHALGLLSAQQQDLGAVLDALESSSSALSVRLAIDVDEVKTVPDMAVVEQVLSVKDVFPDRCGQEPYTYEGNGQGQGGGGVYTDVDLSKFSVERAAEAEKIGEDPMEWAVKDTTVLAALQSTEEKCEEGAAPNGDGSGADGAGAGGAGGDAVEADAGKPPCATEEKTTRSPLAAPECKMEGDKPGTSLSLGVGKSNSKRDLQIATSFPALAVSTESPSTIASHMSSPAAGTPVAMGVVKMDSIASLDLSPPPRADSLGSGWGSPGDGDGGAAASDTDLASVVVSERKPTVEVDDSPASSAPLRSPLAIPAHLVSFDSAYSMASASPMSQPGTPLSLARVSNLVRRGKKVKSRKPRTSRKKKKKKGKGKGLAKNKSNLSQVVSASPIPRGDSAHFFQLPLAAQLSQHTCVPDPRPVQVERTLWSKYSAEDVAKAVTFLPVDTMLMRWVNYHLATARIQQENVDKRIHNFTSDWIDGEAIAVLLHQLAPTYAKDVKVVEAQDPGKRCELSTKQLRDFSPSPVNFVTSEHLASGDARIISALCARLFTTHHGMSPPTSYWKPLQQRTDKLAEAVGELKRSLRSVRGRHAAATAAFAQWSVLLEAAPSTDDTSDAEVTSLHDVVAKYQTCLNEADAVVTPALNQARHGHQLYHEMTARAVQFVWKVFEAKLLGIEHKVLDEREERDLTEYTVIYPAKYKDLLDRYCKNAEHANQEVESMQALLRKYRGELMRIFKYYCASGEGSSISTMCLSEYWTFLRQSQLAPQGFGDKNSARLDLIFGKAKQCIGLPDENEVNPESGWPEHNRACRAELIPRQWVESMVRVGVLLNENRKPEPSLTESLRMVIEEFAVRHATQSNTEAFRAELQTPEVRDVIKKHRAPLLRVFQYYCGHGKDVQGSSDSMDCDAFLKMLRDAHLITRHLTPLVVKHVFALTQLEEMFEDDCGGGGEDEMIYSEFLEGVCAVALHKESNPYVSVSKRVDDFIAKHLLPRAKQAKPKRKQRERRGSGFSPRSIRRHSIELDGNLEAVAVQGITQLHK